VINFHKKLRNYGYRRAFVYLLICCIQKVRYYFYYSILSDNKVAINKSRLHQPAQFIGRGSILLDQVNIGVWPSPHFLTGHAYFEARHSDSCIKIGKNTFLNNNAVIIADKGAIDIGERCLIGTNFYAADSDFHGLELENRNNGNYIHADVSIGNDVFIGNDVRILKGVKVGNGAVIGSGSLVVKDVAEHTIHAGIPAKFIRNV
jgi:acetyltransferase-like isoleucine patch superfamily enzyme